MLRIAALDQVTKKVYAFFDLAETPIMSSQPKAAIMRNSLSPIEGKVRDKSNIDCNNNYVETKDGEPLLEAQLCCKLVNERSFESDGKYTEIEEKDFYQACKETPKMKMVVHFYSRDAPRCTIFDHHLQILAAGHFEAKFVKINAETAPDLAEKLRICSFPTLVIINDGDFKEYICRITGRKNESNFSTEMLERRLVATGVIEYRENYPQPLNNSQKLKILRLHKKNIREHESSDESD